MYVYLYVVCMCYMCFIIYTHNGTYADLHECEMNKRERVRGENKGATRRNLFFITTKYLSSLILLLLLLLLKLSLSSST